MSCSFVHYQFNTVQCCVLSYKCEEFAASGSTFCKEHKDDDCRLRLTRRNIDELDYVLRDIQNDILSVISELKEAIKTS